MIHEMPKLPYGMEELAPQMSKETLEFHYGKHLQTYVNNLNNLIKETRLENLTLEEIIKTADGGIFNNAAQVWNHTFFFETLTPKQVSMPEPLASKLAEDFGSVENFKEEFTKAATGLFGSGWVWLVQDENGKLEIVTKGNAGNPITDCHTPLMVIDVWEHAYYIDYRNNRADFVKAVWNLIDWNKVTERLK